MELKLLFDVNNFLFDNIEECCTPEFTLSNRLSMRESFYTSKVLTEHGAVVTRHPQDAVFAYSITKYRPERADIDILKVVQNTMLEKLQYLEGFLFYLWFVKDNAVFTNSVIAEVPQIEKGVTGMRSNTHAWNSSGKTPPVSFSENEIRLAVKIADKYKEVCKQELVSIGDFSQPEEPNVPLRIGHHDKYNHNDNNAIQRAIMFLRGARKINYTPYRIAMYVPIFECLFSADANEVSHKISERVAFYLSQEKAERKEIYNAMKAAYGLRSRFLHGDVFQPKKANLETAIPLSIQIDHYARLALTKIILEDAAGFLEKDSGKREKFLNDYIFN